MELLCKQPSSSPSQGTAFTILVHGMMLALAVTSGRALPLRLVLLASA